MGKCVGEAPEKSSIQSHGTEVVDDVSIPGKNLEIDPDPGFPGEIVSQRFVAFDLLENILLGDQADQDRFFRGDHVLGRGLGLVAPGLDSETQGESEESSCHFA